MPSTLHQGILALFRADPWLAFDILGIPHPIEGFPIDRRGEVEYDGEEALTINQGFPDLVMVYKDPDDDTYGVVITVEAQKDPDVKKRWRIPVYQALLADEYRVSTWAVVVSFSRRMSRLLRIWAVGPPPKVDVMLLDVDTASTSPWLDDPILRPTAAVLVGALHGHAGDVDAARRGLRATRMFPDEKRRRHAMTVLAALPKQHRDELMGELPVEERDELMEIERESGTYFVGHQAGLERGLEQGLERGLEQGLERGRQALVGLTLSLLAERGVPVDAQSEARIRGCEELSVLQRLARRAFDASSIDELFD